MSSVRPYSPPSIRGAKPLGPVTRKMLHTRTCEIARLAGRNAPYVTQSDYEQAKLELTGDPYALIMDTTIDDEMFYPTPTTHSGLIEPCETQPVATGHRRGGELDTRIFWVSDRPCAGAT